jgi:15-cis-phytoene desaturase
MTMCDEEILELTKHDAARLGIALSASLRAYRVVRHPADFYSLEPGNERLRPLQHTSIPGLTLAGDYTKQPYLATMERAVVSGQRAAPVVLSRETY